MCMSCCVACRICRGTRDVADVGGAWGSGAAAVAGALNKLVNLTSLDLGCRWSMEWAVSYVRVLCCVCVSCGCRGRSAVCVCRVVSCAVVALVRGLWLMLGAYGDQTMGWVPREQRQWRVR